MIPSGIPQGILPAFFQGFHRAIDIICMILIVENVAYKMEVEIMSNLIYEECIKIIVSVPILFHFECG